MALRAGKTSTKDVGEAQSIAAAADDPDLIFVSGDVSAVFTAVNELHEPHPRVITAYVFLRRMYEAGHLAAADVRTCSAQFERYPNKPTWWRPWLASLA